MTGSDRDKAYGREYMRKRREDPAFVAQRQQYMREYRLRRKNDPELAEKDRLYQREYGRKYYHRRKASDPSYLRDNNEYHRVWKYGVSVAGVARLLAFQGRRCCGCGKEISGKSPIDHDHSTRRVRGILCSGCNKVLGFVRDDPATLMNLIRYLENPPASQLKW